VSTVNKAILIGNLGADPELRHTQTGQSVCNFRIATTEKWKDDRNETHENTQWHTIVVWGKSAENCAQYLAKGRSCYVEGRIEERQWEDKEGATRYSTEIIASSVQFLGGGQEQSQQRQEPQQQQRQQPRQQRPQQNQPGRRPQSATDRIPQEYNRSEGDPQRQGGGW